jgi:glyoxylase-like metal-dependent hydrolase (beta-lactamase superfamily II)
MTGGGTNTYLIGERRVAVVDPGPDDARHVEAILAAVPPGGSVAAILLTHGHADHAGAIARLRERSGATLHGHAAVPGVERALGEGDRLRVDGIRVDVLATPGHADDHLCFWLRDRQLLFSGDLVVGSGTVVLSDSPRALGRYLDSLDRLRDLAPFTLLPGHGPVIDDGAAKVAEYVAHRAARERQIVAALAEGPTSVETLVERLYADTPPGLRAMAARNVRAHLERLAELGRASRRGGRWRRKT